MKVQAIDEYNEEGHLIYAQNYMGAFVRGKTKEEALKKFKSEILQYAKWRGIKVESAYCRITVVQEKLSALKVCDADSDVLFDSEKPPLLLKEYQKLKSLTLKSAKDFLTLYSFIPNKNQTTLAPRQTFYGKLPLTAEEMYQHTKNVNAYYFGEIGLSAENTPDIYTCRLKGFEELEKQPDFLENKTYEGSGNELWTLRKLCRRFVWHDRIHAKAMYKMAVNLCGKERVKNPFYFEI